MLVSKIEDLVKSHIETSSNLEKRDEELAASRKSLFQSLRIFILICGFMMSCLGN